ncbi:MAG: FG-GAP repeat protein [Thermoplasmata archaeon]|nr:FG-GAP repeat protein [Thermoplasmata archaeon]
MVSMGVKGFELLLPEGIGERTAVVLQGAAGDEKDLFAYQFLAEGLKAYEGVMVVLSKISPAEFREEMKKHGVKCEAHEEEGSLIIVDWYSYKKGRIDGVQIEGSVFRSSQSLLNLEIAITDATKRLVPYPKRRAVLDVLSPSLKMFGSNEVYAFAQKLRTRLRTENIASLLILEKGMHPDDVVQSIHQSFDGVIDFARERKEDGVERRIGLLFVRGISYEPKYTGYRLVDDRIVVAESAETEEGKLVRMLKRQEELLAKDPSNAMIWFSRGSLFADIGEFEKGLECFDKVLELDRDHMGAWNGRAYALSQLGRTEDATESYKNALVLVAKQVDKDHYERLTSKEGIEKVEPEKVEPEKIEAEKVEIKKRICPLCGAQAFATAEKCPECGTDFARFEGKREDEGILDYLASMGEEEGITDEGVDDLLRRKRDRTVKGKPAKARIGKGAGLTNGLPRERVAKGLVNGLGRVNGLVNGLANAKSGLTNGLTNGSGFTNGLGSGRFVRESRRSKWKVYIVPLIAMVLLSTAFLMPESPGPRVFGVDGYFEDWGDDAILDSRSSDVNPNVDIIATGVETDESAYYVFLYVQVEPGNQVLAGNLQSKLGDFLRVFIDSDGNDETGYAVAGTGADYLVQIVGRDEGQGAVARMHAVYRYIGLDQTDWNAWEHESSALVALGKGEDANKIEIAIPKSVLPNPDTALYVFQMEDWSGDVDFADYRMAGAKGIMHITQESANEETIDPQTSVTVLNLELKKVSYKDDASGSLTLETVRGMLFGTLPASEVEAVTLDTSDGSGGPWTGSVSGNGLVVFQNIGHSFDPGAKTDFTVDFLLRSSAPSGDTVGFRIVSPDDVMISAGATTLESVPTDHDLSYVSSVPSGYVVDGGFSDWTSVMTDGPNEPSTGGYENVDIRQYDLNSTQDDAFFYVRVGGRMLEGTFTPQHGKYIPDPSVPRPDSDRDSIPDDEDDYPFDFDNDGTPDIAEGGDVDNDGVPDWPGGSDHWLETTVQGRDVRVYIGPTIPPPVLRGEDTVRIFIDSDKDAMTGYFVGSIGADFFVEIAGKNGEPLEDRRTMREHVGGPGSWQWVTLKDANVALDLQNLEVSINIAGLGFLQDFPAYFEVMGWADRKDGAVGTRSLTRGDYDGYDAKYTGAYEARVKGTTQSEETVSISHEGNELSWGLPESIRLVSPSSQEVLSTLRNAPLQLGGNEARFEDSHVGLDSSITYTFEEARIKEAIVIRNPLSIAQDGQVVLESEIAFSDWLTPVPLDFGNPIYKTLPPSGAAPERGEVTSPEAFTAPSGIAFSDGTDIVFEIEQAYAFDSGGARVDCEYSYDGESSTKWLAIQCPASWFAQATYPVTIDPTVVLENNASGEGLGYNITTGDFNDDAAMDVAVGAPANNMNDDSDIGAVFIYYGGTSLDDSYDLIIHAPSGSVRFGAAVAAGDIDNDGDDDLIVGDPGYASDDGRAYLYYGSTSFDGTADETFSAPDSSGEFGFAIATGDLNSPTDSYDDIVITAPKYNSDDGRAYVYFGNTSGDMDTTNDGVLDPPAGGQAGLMGHSVATGQFEASDTNDDVFLGEPWYDDTNTDQGRMYVFYGGSGSSFDTTIDITSEPDTGYGDGRFGYSIGVGDSDNDGDEDAWVGAPFGDFPGETNGGLLYIVNGGEGNGNYDGGWYSSAGTYLGISVAVGDIENDNEEDGVVGSRASTNDQGRVTVFWQGGGTNVVWTGTNSGDRLGFALATGDIDDDTYDDVVVGTPGYSSGDGDGRVSVYYGDIDSAFDSTADLSFSSSADERFGFSLAKGDFNNDGNDDLAVGAPYLDGGDGAVYMYFGTASGLSDHQMPGLVYQYERSGELFGWNVTAGDFNGDNYDDLLVGAPSNDEDFTNGGRAYIFYGGDGTDMDGDGVDVDIESETDGEQFGWSVAAGNVESTGNDDAIIGAPTYDTDKGRVYVYSAFTTPTETTPDVTLQRGDSERFGSSIATMNYDEDSYEDILVGAPLNDSDSNTDKGVAFVYRGAADMDAWFPVPGQGGNITTYEKHDPGDNTNQVIGNLTSDNEVYYKVIGDGTRWMWIINFDTTGLSGQITSVMLYVQYKTDAGYSETEPIKIYNGSSWVDTGIVPSNQGSDYDDSDDIYALGVDSWSKITGLHVRFSNPSSNKDVDFDYMAVNVSVSEGEEANITLKGQYAGDYTGLSVAAGDFDGDSSYSDDAVLGAPGWYQATNDTGAVYVYSGTSIRGLSGDGTLSTPDDTIMGPGSTDAKFGWSVASAEMTGDGYNELLVGAPFNGTSDDDGAMYAYVGSASGFGGPGYVKDGKENENLGYDVVGGDFVTGGYDDIAGGGPFLGTSDNDGRVFIENIPEFEEILIPLMLVIAIPILIRRRLRR